MNHLVKIFESVRDIPYKVSLTYEEDTSCSGKSEKLFKLLANEGYKVRYRICEFSWNDLKLPEEVMSVPHEGSCTHLFIEVYINGKWKIVDPTWDKKLGKVFHINSWDGKSDTEIAVKPAKIYTPKKSLSYLRSTQTKKSFDDDLSRNGNFYTAFNQWLDQIRKGLNFSDLVKILPTEDLIEPPKRNLKSLN